MYTPCSHRMIPPMHRPCRWLESPRTAPLTDRPPPARVRGSPGGIKSGMHAHSAPSPNRLSHHHRHSAPCAQSSVVQSSVVQCSTVQSSPVQSSPVQSVPVRSSPFQFQFQFQSQFQFQFQFQFQSSPVQSSPVQSSPVQSSPVQSSPVQSRWLLVPCTPPTSPGDGSSGIQLT